jgi:uncharacterized protein (TIGR02466 family)
MAIGIKFQLQSPHEGGVRLGAHDLFPTRIWQASLKDRGLDFGNLVNLISAIRRQQPDPARRSNRRGWNSVDKAILGGAGFAGVDALIRSGIGSALKEMGAAAINYDLESWINIHDEGGFNFPHVHEGSYLSGCFYLQVPRGSGNLIFRDPRAGVVHGLFKGPVANGYRDVSLRPEDGLLVLFPAWLEHFVEPHESDEPRIVIAFNAVSIVAPVSPV